MINTAIIYHQVKPNTDCPDGIAAAWVAAQANPNASIIGCCYGAAVPDVSSFDEVLIVDFSFKREVLEDWKSQGKKVIVIDHHKTALQDLSGFVNAVFDMNESGATLTWKYIFPNKPMPAFLEYVRDRDLWNFDLPNSEEIHEGISSIKKEATSISQTFTIFDMLSDLSREQLQEIVAPIGERLLIPKRERIAELAKLAVDDSFKNLSCKSVEIDEKDGRLVSDLCSYLYKAHPEVDFILAYYRSLDENQSIKFNLSFRSDKKGQNTDVSAIARELGGGGHHNASGAVVDIENMPFNFVEQM